MIKRILLGVVWVSVTAAVVGFFLPWAMLDLREPSMVKQLREASPVSGTLGGLTKDLGRIVVKVRRGAETVTGDLPSLKDIPKQVSGVQIPQMANSEHAQVAMALIELFTKDRQHVGVKSYAVYVIPGLALLCGVLLTELGGRVAVAFGVAGLCALVSGVGFYKVLTTNTQALFIAITIGQGIWLSLWAYAGLALAGGGLGGCALLKRSGATTA